MRLRRTWGTLDAWAPLDIWGDPAEVGTIFYGDSGFAFPQRLKPAAFLGRFMSGLKPVPFILKLVPFKGRLTFLSACLLLLLR